MKFVLLIEDNQDVANALTKVLKRGGYAVRHAANIAEARAVINDVPVGLIDAVVTDRDVPDGNAWTYIRGRVEAQHLVSAKVVYMTGSIHRPADPSALLFRKGEDLPSKLIALLEAP